MDRDILIFVHNILGNLHQAFGLTFITSSDRSNLGTPFLLLHYQENDRTAGHYQSLSPQEC